MPLLPNDRVHLFAPLIDHRLTMDGKLVYYSWYHPPKGGNYRTCVVEIWKLFPTEPVVVEVIDRLDVESGWPVMLHCRLPRSLVPAVPMKHGDVKPPLEVHLQARIRGVRGITGMSPGVLVGSRPRTPGVQVHPSMFPTTRRQATWDDDPYAAHERATSRDWSWPTEEERAEGLGIQRPMPIMSAEDRAWLQGYPLDELPAILERLQRGETPEQIRQQKENDQ